MRLIELLYAALLGVLLALAAKLALGLIAFFQWVFAS